MKKVFTFLLGFIVGLVFIYGSYWLIKTGSYWLFYEDMVKQTIHEMVKSVALK
jgi:hypothetical protein